MSKVFCIFILVILADSLASNPNDKSSQAHYSFANQLMSYNNGVIIMEYNQLPTQSEINKLLYYDMGKLFWKTSYRNQLNLSKEAGFPHASGYRHIGINQVQYKIHRIIWVMFMGNIPKGFVVDHIDRNKSNNKIENLRLLTLPQNCANNGSKGCTWHKRIKKWQAKIGYAGDRIHLGYFANKEDASKIYFKARKLLHGV